MDFDEPSLEKLAIPAGVLSHVKTLDSGTHFATMFARSDTGSANMKDVRFRKLLSIDDKDHDARYTMLLRMVRLMGDKAGLDGLVEGTCFLERPFPPQMGAEILLGKKIDYIRR